MSLQQDPERAELGLVVMAFHPRLHTTQIIVEYDEVDGVGKLVKKLSKSQKIVKKSKKPQRPGKLQRSSARRNVYQRTDPSSKNSSFCWSFNSFRALFARPGSSLNIIFDLIIDKAKLIELLMHCPYQVFICAAHVFSSLLQL